jgi:hypothetical protein
MGFRRLKFLGVAAVTAMLAVLPCEAQPTPTTVPTTTFQNDFEVTGNTWLDGNLRVAGTQTVVGPTTYTGNVTVTGTITSTGAMQAPSQILTGTSFNAVLVALAAIGQTTTFTFPDPGSATDTVATLKAANTFTGVNTFPTGGIVLSGTSFNGTLKEVAALGQATTYTLPDPGVSTDTIMTLAAAQSVTGVKTYARGATLPTMGTGTATYNPGGRLFSLSATSSSSTGGATNTTYTLPANTLTTTGQGLRVKIHGTTASNGNTKACNFLWGGAPVTITLPLSTGSAKDFYADILIYRTGSSAQELSVAGFANNAFIGGLSTTATATESGTLAMELNLPTSTGAADVVVDEFSIYAEQ